MPYLIGTDEAGYGPNLGPLVIGGSIWHVPDERVDLFDALHPVVCRPGKNEDGPESAVAIGDSKLLYRSRHSIATLEHSVLAMLGAIESVPGDLFELFRDVAGQTAIQLASETTYCWNDVSVPLDCNEQRIRQSAVRLRRHMDDVQVHCRGMAAVMVFPEAFNRGLDDCGNKATLLSGATCQLVRRLLDSVELSEQQAVSILCDKHGGRAHYAGLIQQEMTDSFVQVVHESREVSHYRWSEGERTFDIRFIARGESHLPIAMGSMIAKYLREISMRAWNRFWQEQMPDLLPTAGYPQDARRFKTEISAMQTRLNVEDRVIWRNK